MSLTEQLLRGLSPAKPLITHYDDARGTRMELSVATVANWAAKTANWLVEEHDVEPGTEVAVRMPGHWQTAGILLGAWWAGAHVVADPAGAAVVVVPEGAEADARTAVVSLDPMGMDLRGRQAAGTDFVAEVRLFGDAYFGAPVPDGTPALAGLTVAEVLAAADELPAGVRALSTAEWTIPAGVLRAFVSPLKAGGSVVHVSNPDAGALDKHRATERTTHDILG
ncbi:TIGR03089 family protein [Actinokineospora bangkokensis]|uniref:TIGR03089 family protein n=1 Tax=Actinokineospora bangkokensis TaxID=1193682 RepID=A0A1Q9LEJ1_9PSEU|nr:TIGR03089 family protein [Actinokineospora bangkokensis]OLR90446.1 TIGR03089 family protein [Actinokineospora bangkokensis]